MVCDVLHRLAWIYNRGTPLRPYIHYYNRAAVLSCIASGVALVSGMRWRCCVAVMCSNVAQAVLYPLVSVWYRERLNGSNSRKNTCKALCAVLCRWRYSCIDDAKRAVNACMGLYCSRAKQKPCIFSRCKAKEKPLPRGGVAFVLCGHSGVITPL